MDCLFLMHDDAEAPETASWEDYIGRLASEGVFMGGSSMAMLTSLRMSAPAKPNSGIIGFIRITCRDLDHARALVEGNPTYLAGGTVEIRQLVEDA